MRAAKEYSNRSAQRSSNDAMNATIQRLQVDLAKVKKELRDQKAINATARPVDKDRLASCRCISIPNAGNVH